ncbi:MAG: hypothetical protein K9K37_01195 [Desulfocapsa sp.]|nr:hypothetical protein [Desulfocapsa sp.]
MKISNKLSTHLLLHTLGILLVLLSLGYIGTLLWSQREVILAWRPDAKDISILLFSIMSYAASGMLLAKAWHELLLWSGEVNISNADTCSIYGRSQIAKYIPGNIAQLVGRHVIGRQRGWSHIALVISSTMEMVSLLFVTSIIAIIGLSLTEVAVDRLSLPLLTLLACGLLAGIMSVLYTGPRIVKHRWPEIALKLHNCSTISLWKTSFFHILFFGVSGLIFFLIGFVVLGQPFPPSLWPGVFGLVAFAWVVGIVTPGAPSGIGVREGVLALGLVNITTTSEMLLIVGLFRLVTVSGDIVFFLAATGFSYYRTSSSA